MKLEKFQDILIKKLEHIGKSIEEDKIDKLYKYMQILLEENEKINLTAITDPYEIIVKHFVDSISIEQFIEEKSKAIDVGTGAGFPGLAMATYREDINFTLLDSLNKRTEFLKKVVREINIKNVNVIWGRSEDFGKNSEYREMYDVATARAVAPLNVLLEYLIPFIRVGGICICMKGPSYKDEIINAENALKKLGGEIKEIKTISIENMEREIVIVEKKVKTNSIYPRKAGIPSKKPIL